MKLRNICLAIWGICTLASCSKGDDPVVGPVGPADASVSFATATMEVKGLRSSKATDSEVIGKEQLVKKLTAYIFKDNGDNDELNVLAVKSTVQADPKDEKSTISAINKIVVKVTPTADNQSSEDRFIAILVANGKDREVTNLAELKQATLSEDIASYLPGKAVLPMVSEPIRFYGLKPIVKTTDGATTTTAYVENWIDAAGGAVVPVDGTGTVPPVGLSEVMLNRLIARVQVESITFSPAGDGNPDASFQLTNLSLVNVRPASTLEAGVGAYVKGYESTGYQAMPNPWIDPASSATWKKYEQVLGTYYSGADYLLSKTNRIDWTVDTQNKFYSYAFANEADAPYQTALLISGIYYQHTPTLENGYKGEVKNFRVIVQDPKDAGVIKVKPNNVYKLTITITGAGSSNEDNIEKNASVSALITVEDWNVVEWTEDDVN